MTVHITGGDPDDQFRRMLERFVEDENEPSGEAMLFMAHECLVWLAGQRRIGGKIPFSDRLVLRRARRWLAAQLWFRDRPPPPD